MRTSPSPLRFAIIGCGLVVEQCHLPALRKIAGLKLVALADPDLERLTRIADRAAVGRRHTDYRALLDDPGIDLVAVCAPPQLHAEIGLAVLDAGKHLFLEKPLALSLRDADRLVKRPAGVGGQALIGFNFRWHRLVRKARSIIDGGGLGPLATMHTTFASASAFRQQDTAWRQRQDLGGVLVDLGIHHFDLWRFLTGSEVAEVLVHRRTDGPGHERATVSAAMTNGVLVTSSFSHGLSDANELEICGAKASLRLSCYRFDSLRVSENGAPRGAVRHWAGDAARGLRNVPQAIARLLDGGDIIDSYRGQWQSFVDAIRNNMPIKPGLEDGRSALQIALAGEQSARSGRSVRVHEAMDPAVSFTAVAPGISPTDKVARVTDQIEKAANGVPTMSVVVITPDGYDTISAVLRHVHAQSVKEQLEIVIVAPASDALQLDIPALHGFHGVRVVTFGAVASSTAAARAAGVQAARAPIVAFVEDHCFPQRGWAAALIAAHREPWAAVGPAIGNANPCNAVSWANLLIEYSPWMDPAAAGPVEHLPGHNSSYKRTILLDYGPALETMLETESVMHWDLRGKGFDLLLEPAAVALHVNFTTIAASTRLRFHGGRMFAAARARRWSFARRIAYAAAAPLIPVVRLRRILAQVWRRRNSALPANTFPALALLLACDAAGELAGYLLGAGAEARRAGEFEFHDDRRAVGVAPHEGHRP